MKEGKAVPSRLGKGLSTLLSDLQLDASSITPERPARRSVLPIEALRPNPNQPRRQFDQDALSDLVQSVAAKGILQPLIVRPVGDGMHEIVAGERRWRAAQIAGLHEVPAIVRDVNDDEAAQIALIENVQRSDLNPVEEASAYKDLQDRFGYTQDQLSEIIGKSRSHIANATRLLRLPPRVLEMLASQSLSAGHARALLMVEDPESLAVEVLRRGLNVRQTEKLVKDKSTPAAGPEAGVVSGKSVREVDPDTAILEGELSANLRMSVRIQHEAGTERGALQIRYNTLDDLDLLCRILGTVSRDDLV